VQVRAIFPSVGIAGVLLGVFVMLNFQACIKWLIGRYESPLPAIIESIDYGITALAEC